MVPMQSGSKKSLNFELNLLPVFDILSCCICFLLITVAWVQVGSINVNQAVGAQGLNSEQNPPAVWAYLNSHGQVVLSIKNMKVADWMGESVLSGESDGSISWNVVNQRIQAIRNAATNIKTAIVLPTAKTSYQDIVRIMDSFKQVGIGDVGISPL